MSIRITKLHIILFLTAVALTVFFFAQQNNAVSFNRFMTFLSQFMKTEEKKPPPPVKKPPKVVDIEQVRRNTRQVVAIAGEEMKIAKKQGKDIAHGQMTLRKAKELLKEGEYTLAVREALASIDLFKNASSRLLASYTVKRGDNLWNISKRRDVYGRGARWYVLWRANEEKIPDFDYIYRGQVLKIPRD